MSWDDDDPFYLGDLRPEPDADAAYQEQKDEEAEAAAARRPGGVGSVHSTPEGHRRTPALVVRHVEQEASHHAPGCDANCTGFFEGLTEQLRDERGPVYAFDTACCACECHNER